MYFTSHRCRVEQDERLMNCQRHFVALNQNDIRPLDAIADPEALTTLSFADKLGLGHASTDSSDNTNPSKGECDACWRLALEPSGWSDFDRRKVDFGIALEWHW